MPVASQALADEPALRVSSATIRHEMALLEQEGYIMRPHTSAGSVPIDKGYRFYVESLGEMRLPTTEQRLISHLFHQAEKEIENWLKLAATLLAQTVRNVALVSLPRPVGCKFKHVEVVSLQEHRALIVLVLEGARIKQKLITFEGEVHQPGLTVTSQRLSEGFAGLAAPQIEKRPCDSGTLDEQIQGHIIEMMQGVDTEPSEEIYFEGLQYMMSQPEFSRSDRIGALVDLVETRQLLSAIRPMAMSPKTLHVVIGTENRADIIKDYSVVLTQYGLPDEGMGTLGVVGPTRMHYSHTIPTVAYLSSVLTHLMAGLYGHDNPDREADNTNQ